MIPELVGLIVSIYIIYFLVSLAVGSASKLPPGPLPLPIIGNVHLLSNKPHMDFTRLGQIYGPVYKLQLGRQLAVVINDLKLVKEAARKGTDFAGRPKTISGDLFSGNGRSIGFQDYSEQWKRQHRALATAIRACEGKNGPLESVAIQEIEKLRGRLAQQCGSTFDPRLDIGLVLTNILTMAMFGFSFEADDPDFHSLLQQTKDFSSALAAANFLDAFPFLQTFPFQVIKTLKETAMKRDAIFRAKHEEHGQTFEVGHIRDIADALIQAEIDEKQSQVPDTARGLDEKRRVYTLNESMIAGIETPLASLLWTIALLVKYPDVQKRLQDAIEEVTGGHHVILTSKDRGKLPYMEAVIMESLRLVTTLPVAVPHSTTTDTTLAGYTIPKGTTTFFNLWGIHHDPNTWTNPMEFNPDRLIDGDGRFSSSGLVPFSMGHRSCPWESVSRKVMFMLLANLFQEFTLESSPGYALPDILDCKFGITLTPQDYRPVILRKRI